MKKRFLKEKALFIILILILSILSFPVFSENVKAQETQKGCCQKTKDGSFCRMTEQSNCESGKFNPVSSCEDDSICSSQTTVCCQNPDTGICSRTSQTECSDKGFKSFTSDPSCESVSECKPGCCILGSNCQITTNLQCQSIASDNPGLTPEFKQDVVDTECTDICKSMEEGCCITEGTYTYVKKVDCKGEFNLGKLCSSLNNSPCEKHKGTGCHDGDVHYKDSCGNKEELKEECKLENSKFCKENKESNSASCEDTSCKDPYIDKWNIHDPNIGPGKVKQEGEAWCIYESLIGN